MRRAQRSRSGRAEDADWCARCFTGGVASTYGTEPSLTTRIHELGKLLGREGGEAWREECRANLDIARGSLKETSRDFGAYDAVWRALHQIRHKLCLHAPWEEVDVIANEILVDLEYVTDPTERDEHKKSTRKLIERLCAAPPSDAELAEIGRALHNLSIIAAGCRESRWRKANRTRTRLSNTNRGLLVFLTLCTLLLPGVTDDLLPWRKPSLWAEALASLLTLIAFGALGGMLSGLQARESLSASSIDHHLEQITLRLRPTVGATAAVILYLLMRTGVLNLGVLTKGPLEVSIPVLLVAFVGGFSERFFVDQIDKLAAKVAAPAKHA